MKTFWILWNPQGNTPPTVRFATFEAAKETAEKMQFKIGPGTMFVMQAVAGATFSIKGKWEKFDGKQ